MQRIDYREYDFNFFEEYFDGNVRSHICNIYECFSNQGCLISEYFEEILDKMRLEETPQEIMSSCHFLASLMVDINYPSEYQDPEFYALTIAIADFMVLDHIDMKSIETPLQSEIDDILENGALLNINPIASEIEQVQIKISPSEDFHEEWDMGIREPSTERVRSHRTKVNPIREIDEVNYQELRQDYPQTPSTVYLQNLMTVSYEECLSHVGEDHAIKHSFPGTTYPDIVLCTQQYDSIEREVARMLYSTTEMRRAELIIHSQDIEKQHRFDDDNDRFGKTYYVMGRKWIGEEGQIYVWNGHWIFDNCYGVANIIGVAEVGEQDNYDACFVTLSTGPFFILMDVRNKKGEAGSTIAKRVEYMRGKNLPFKNIVQQYFFITNFSLFCRQWKRCYFIPAFCPYEEAMEKKYVWYLESFGRPYSNVSKFISSLYAEDFVWFKEFEGEIMPVSLLHNYKEIWCAPKHRQGFTKKYVYYRNQRKFIIITLP